MELVTNLECDIACEDHTLYFHAPTAQIYSANSDKEHIQHYNFVSKQINQNQENPE